LRGVSRSGALSSLLIYDSACLKISFFLVLLVPAPIIGA
jgi:hypothetical protein